MALHITNGDATVPELLATGLMDAVLPWRDVLHEGPVPEVGDEELRTIRAAFLAGEDADDIGTAAEFAARDATLAAHRDGEYVLWFEADLYDQLQLVQILARLRALSVAPAVILLVGDTWAFDRLARMAVGPAPLVVAGATRVDRFTPVALTDVGRDVLDGRADLVARNGIDRWIGGVHLHGHEVPWRFDEGREAVRAAG